MGNTHRKRIPLPVTMMSLEPKVSEYAEALEPMLAGKLYQLAKQELNTWSWDHQLIEKGDRKVLSIGQDGHGNPIVEYSWTSKEDLQCHTPEHGFRIYDIQQDIMDEWLKPWEITEDGENFYDDDLDFENLPHCYQATPKLPDQLPKVEQHSFLLPVPSTMLGIASLLLSQRISINLAAQLSEYVDPHKLDEIMDLAGYEVKTNAAADKAILEAIENSHRRTAVEDHYWQTATGLNTESPEVRAHELMKQEQAAGLDNHWSLQEDPTGPPDIVTLAGDACQILMAQAINQDCLASLVERSERPANPFLNPNLKLKLDDYRDLARNFEPLQVIRQTNPGLYHLYLDRRTDRKEKETKPQEILDTLRGRRKQRLNRPEWRIFIRLADMNMQKRHFNLPLRELRQRARMIATAKTPQCEDADLLTAATCESLIKLWRNPKLDRRYAERRECTILLKAFLKPGGERKTGPILTLVAHATKRILTQNRQWKQDEWARILEQYRRWRHERTVRQRESSRRIRGILVPEYEHLGCTIIPMGSRGELRDATKFAWGLLKEFLEMVDYEQPDQRYWDRNIRYHLITDDEHGQLAVITVRTETDGIWRARLAIIPPTSWGKKPLEEIETELGRRYRLKAGQPEVAPPAPEKAGRRRMTGPP